MRVERVVRVAGRAGVLGAFLGTGLETARAQEAVQAAAKPVLALLHTQNVAGLAVVIGLILFSTILSLLHLRERARWTRRESELLADLSSLRGAHDRAEMLLNAERQVIVTWAGKNAPLIDGDTSLALSEARDRSRDDARRILDFGAWLAPDDAASLDAAVEALRRRGTGFRLKLRSLDGRYFEAQGLAVSGRALLRLRETTEERRELSVQRGILDEARRAIAALAGLLDAIPHPVWHRRADGTLAFVNAAYVAAVEGGTREATIEAGTELLDRSAREQILRDAGEASGGTGRPTRLSGIVAGARRILDVTETAVESGRIGIAVDVSDLEEAHADLRRQMEAHVRTLDQLPTAIAMFDARRRLIFHNAAYQRLWDLDSDFLDGKPRDGEILDRLRAARKLPEQADFRTWKAEVLAAYQTVGATEVPWYLPDGRSLRVIADPNPQGGLTYLFHDVSESMALASRYSTLMKVQAETLDSLKEPVAVFAADGRLTVANRAFEKVWRIDEAVLKDRPRIDAVIAACRMLSPDPAPWMDIRAAITGLVDARSGLACRLEVLDGTVLDCAAQPLPEGATLLTFIDVTASVNVERALTEKNEALERASQLRDTFVHHVSYELRSPLTNIIGFTQLLGDETVGALNDRQREYAEHIMRSSAALLVIINDILDLASIDAGSFELERETVDVRETIEAAVRGVEDRLAESRIVLDRDVAADVGSFDADGKRVRQILFNLLSNAIGFSSEGQHVRVEARRIDKELVLSVADQGRGIAPDVIARVFDRFESHTLGTKHRGVGLGLSIVRSLVELHGGRVTINSAPGKGARVTCYFPIKAPNGITEAAE